MSAPEARRVKRAHRTLKLYVGGDHDLAIRYQELDRQLITAADVRPDSLAAGSPARAIEAEMREIEAKMAEETIEFHLEAMPRRAFRDLAEQHPPRTGDDGELHRLDKMGFNAATLPGPLIRASIVSPEFADEELTALLDEDLSDAQYDELFLACYSLNRGTVDVPFSSAASRQNHSSAPE
jgi:hypothetical protein